MNARSTLLKERHVKTLASLLKVACYLLILFFAFSIVLSIIGRQTFTLHSSTGVYEDAILAEDEHDASGTRWLTMHPAGELRVHADDDVGVAARIGISALTITGILPMILAFWYLSRVLSNIEGGSIFVEKNAHYILCYGLLQLFSAVGAPFLQLLICSVVNAVSITEMSFSTGQNMLGGIFHGVAFLIAAYIIRYGVRLQDEADHTL